MANKEPKQWITVNGQHIPIFEGETKDQAVNRYIAKTNEEKKQKDIARNKAQADKLNGKKSKEQTKEQKLAELKKQYDATPSILTKSAIKTKMEMIEADWKGTEDEFLAHQEAEHQKRVQASLAKDKERKAKLAEQQKASENSWRLQHRPGNPEDGAATVDKIANGDYFPKDILDHARDYFPDYGNYKGVEKLISILKRAQNNPEMEVTIYRGAPSGGKLHKGDWVTLSEEYAKVYAAGGAYADNPNSKVYSYKCKVKDLSFDGDSIYEFGYWGNDRDK